MAEEKGFQNNILIYRLVNDFVFGYFIAKIDPILKNPFDKDFNRINFKALIKISLFGLTLIVLNCYVFIQFKQPTLFDYMGLNRMCTDS